MQNMVANKQRHEKEQAQHWERMKREGKSTIQLDDVEPCPGAPYVTGAELLARLKQRDALEFTGNHAETRIAELAYPTYSGSALSTNFDQVCDGELMWPPPIQVGCMFRRESSW